MSVKVASIYAEATLKDNMTPGLKNAKSSLEGFKGGLKDSLLSLVGFTSAAALAGVAVNKTVQFFRDSVREAAQMQSTLSMLGATLKATGRAAEVGADQIDKWATALMRTSTFDDKEIISAYNAISRFEDIPTENIEGIVKTAMDMATVLGGDLTTNAESIAKILETGLIPRTWGWNQELKDQVAQLVKSGDRGAAMTIVMQNLNRQFGGQAAQAIDTYAGSTKRLADEWGLFMENIGGGAMTPGQKINKWFTELVKSFNDMFDAARPNLAWSKAMTDAQKLLGGTFGNNSKQVMDLTKQLYQWSLVNPALIAQQDALNAAIGNGTKKESDYTDLISSSSVPTLKQLELQAFQTALAMDGQIDSADALAIAGFSKSLGEMTQKEYEAMVQAINFKKALDDLAGMKITITIDILQNVSSLLQGGASPDTAAAQAAAWAQYGYATVAGMGNTPALPAGSTTGMSAQNQWRVANGYEPNARYGSVGGKASGGWLGQDGAFVGDMPGGGMTPWTEYIDPRGYVHSAGETRKMMELGLIPRTAGHYPIGSTSTMVSDTGSVGRVRPPREPSSSTWSGMWGAGQPKATGSTSTTPTWNQMWGEGQTTTLQPTQMASNSAVTQAVTSAAVSTQQAAQTTAASTQAVSQAAVKISDSSAQTTQATRNQTAMTLASNKQITDKLDEIKYLLQRNFTNMPRAWAQAQAKGMIK